ncbi:hypothetical protein [Leptolyngbya sp. GB1-A1]
MQACTGKRIRAIGLLLRQRVPTSRSPISNPYLRVSTAKTI